MIINISEIISTTAKTEFFTVPLDMDTIQVNHTEYALDEKEPVELVISNTGNREVHITGHMHVVVLIPCDRCLQDVRTAFDLDIDRTVDFKDSDQARIESLDEMSYIEHSELDVDLLVYNEILLHFPMKTLCREDCKGLCLRCGQDLNKGECGCDRESLDPRMSVIRDIFNQFKEV